MAELFFSSLKKERNSKRIYKNRDLARADVFDYIEVFYNRAGATVTPAASVRRPSNRPRREDRICLQAWGQSIVTSNVSYEPSVFSPLREVSFFEIPVKRE